MDGNYSPSFDTVGVTSEVYTANGLTIECCRYGRICMMTITGSTTSSINQWSMITTIADKYKSAGTAFFGGSDLVYLNGAGNLAAKVTISSGTYVEATATYMSRNA